MPSSRERHGGPQVQHRHASCSYGFDSGRDCQTVGGGPLLTWVVVRPLLAQPFIHQHGRQRVRPLLKVRLHGRDQACVEGKADRVAGSSHLSHSQREEHVRSRVRGVVEQLVHPHHGAERRAVLRRP